MKIMLENRISRRIEKISTMNFEDNITPVEVAAVAGPEEWFFTMGISPAETVEAKEIKFFPEYRTRAYI